MLNGLYPVIVFQKINEVRGRMENGRIVSTDVSGTALSKPIPIYLDEQLTGIALISQSRRVEFANDTIVDNATGEMKVKQRGVSNSVDIELKANRNSTGLNILLPLVNIAFQMAALGKYVISYFNQNVILFSAKLTNFVADENSDNTAVIIRFSLSAEEKEASTEDNNIISKTSGSNTQPDLIR